MKWYSGTTLLDYLEQVDVNETAEQGFYLPVQRVCRPDHTFRGYQGQIESGQIRTGDQVTVLPGNETAGISSILAGDRSVQEAAAGQAVTLQLDREIDISRGSVICKDAALETADTITATLIWMDDMPLQNGNHYFVKLGTGMLPGLVTKILYTVDINTGKFRETDILQKNEIAVCRIVLTDRIPADRFRTHRTLGELILIDRVSFMTSACGVVEQCEKSSGFTGEKATEETRCACLGQKSVTVAFRSADGISEALLEKAEKKLLLGGRHTYLLAPDPAWNVSQTKAVLAHLNRAGIIVMLLLTEQDAEHFQERMRTDVIWYAGEHRDADAISSFVRSVSTWTNDVVNGPQYI
ncbi:MAG: sulfate adenylyltransferase, partial [Eubacterium sp.]|nr:sulfate adenylyltransferase [Eubacterium sp.]